jgi:hypothetical protein
MDKYYYLCEFDYGGTGQFYQEIENGIVLRLINLDGTDLVTEDPYGYYVTDTEPELNLFA